MPASSLGVNHPGGGIFRTFPPRAPVGPVVGPSLLLYHQRLSPWDPGERSMTAENRYEPREIEARWQGRWEEESTFRASNPGDADFDPARPKYYVLDMFPYPSGSGLHEIGRAHV